MSDFNTLMSNIDRSQDAVWQVARYIVSKGYKISVTPTVKASNASELSDFVDEGDIYIQQRIEVKGLGAEFTCAEDWKFGKEFMVCAKNSYDRANPKPSKYIYLNKARTHMATLDTNTHKQWFVKRYKDKRYNDMEQDFYICPTELLKFSEYAL